MEEQMFSGPTVPLNVIEGLSPSESQLLMEHGIDSVEQLSRMPEDDLCEMLDISLDEARTLLDSARMIVEAKAERDIALASAPAAEAEEEVEGENAEEGEIEAAGDADESAVEASATEEETAEEEPAAEQTESSEGASTEEEHTEEEAK